MTKEKYGKIGLARNIVRIVILAAIVVGLCVHTGFGTYSSAGIGFIASVCPLGALEALCGSLAFVPRLIIGLVVMLLIVFLVGRSFCSWVCPVPPLRSFFSTKKLKQAERTADEEAGEEAYRKYEVLLQPSTSDADAPKETKARLDSRHLVLCGALGSAAIFGFPVFCLICPVGLTCGILVLLMRLLGVGELSAGLLIMPVVLILEMTVLRKYCSKICPISALMSLVGMANRTLRPHVDTEKCLRSEGIACHACSSACTERIDPRGNLGEMALNECTRCAKCAEVCPKDAITFPILPKK